MKLMAWYILGALFLGSEILDNSSLSVSYVVVVVIQGVVVVTITTRCVVAQKSAFLINFAAEA
jgi:hypothetical protein